jgi:restriction system protein
MFLGKSALAAGLKPLAPFGWLALVVGCGLLWWEMNHAKAKSFRQSEPGSMDLAPTLGVDKHRFKDKLSSELRAAIEPAPLLQEPVASRPLRWGQEVFDVIEWRRFEAVVETLFLQSGFETKSQSHGADEGIDIWLYAKGAPDVPVSVVQCKHWHGKRVGVEKIRELRGAMAAKNVSRGQFATTSTYTTDAVAFAKDNGINLLDVNGLLALIARRSEAQQAALLKVALEGDYARPTCVNCGTKMAERKPRKGGALFWGCPGYPSCKTTMAMRTA